MITSDRYRFVFLRMPRTASLSLSRYLCREYGGWEPQDHDHYHNFRCEAAYSRYAHFSVIRHPLTRFLSMYNHAVHMHGWRYTFEQTVDIACSGDGWMFRLPVTTDWWLPQITLLSHARREVHLLRFEQLAEDFAALRFVDRCVEMIRGELPVTHAHRGRYDPRDSYTPELAAKVCAVYARDFMAFPGYLPSIDQMLEPCLPPAASIPGNG